METIEALFYIGVTIVIIGIIVGLYMFPSLIAEKRGHKNKNSIAIINFFFGWTFFFWVVCLAWSFSSNVRKK